MSFAGCHPERRGGGRRVRPALQAVRSVAAALITILACSSALQAQGVGWSPLPTDHWARRALELLEARGATAPGRAMFGPLPASTAESLLTSASQVPWASAAVALLREEAGGSVGGRVGLGAEGAGGTLRSAWDPGGVVGLWAGGPEDRVFAFATLEEAPDAPRGALRRGAVGTRLGPLWIQAGRERHQLGGGAGGSLVLSPSAAIDGVTVQTPEPFYLPILGAVQILAGLGPASVVDAVSDPWFALSRVVARPTSWLQMGFSRGALVGGDFPGGEVPYLPGEIAPADSVDLGVGDLVDAFLGRPSVFDDQVWAFDVRVSLATVGVPAVLYGELGLEDNEQSFHDPAVLAGISVAPSATVPLGLRYEYAAFGPPAAIFGEGDRLPTWWYLHNRFLDGWRMGEELLGHPLGGYGLQHTLALTAFSMDLRRFIEVSGSRLRRDDLNLLAGLRPGWAWQGSIAAHVRWAGGLEASVDASLQEGDPSWSLRTVKTTLSWYF